MSQKGPQPDFSWVSIFRAAMLVMRATQRNEIIGGRDDFGPIVRRLLVLFGGTFRSMKAVGRSPQNTANTALSRVERRASVLTAILTPQGVSICAKTAIESITSFSRKRLST